MYVLFMYYYVLPLGTMGCREHVSVRDECPPAELPPAGLDYGHHPRIFLGVGSDAPYDAGGVPRVLPAARCA